MLFPGDAHQSDAALRRSGGACANWARKHKACVVVDNTFATPVLQKPLELGADIVIHSATKYLGGHSDLTAGVLAGSKKWMDAARQTMILTGGCLDPGCAYLLLRGLKTLHVRVERACRNAAQIAEALQRHPKVAQRLLSRTADDPRRTSWRAPDEGLRHDGVVRHSWRRARRPNASSTS